MALATVLCRDRRASSVRIHSSSSVTSGALCSRRAARRCSWLWPLIARSRPRANLFEQTAALAVMPDHLHQVTSAASEDKQMTTVRILPEALLNHQRQAGPPLAHVPLRVAQARYARSPARPASG